MPKPTDPSVGEIRIVVLSCGGLGAEVAGHLAALERVAAVTLITTPYRRPKKLSNKIREVWRRQGVFGFVCIGWGKLTQFAGGRVTIESRKPPPAGVRELRFADFHDPDCLAAIRNIAPDLGVVVGTYFLKESVFLIPRQGSINLHSGKVPNYRGAAPGFWELFNGEAEVGITVHRVTAALDAGAILAEASVPIDSTPAGDPMAYLERFRADVLQPLGVRTLVGAVAAIAAGTVQERPQPREGAHTWRTPSVEAVRQLRRRVAARRSGLGT